MIPKHTKATKDKITNSLKGTREKRRSQKCTVYTLKVQSNKLSASKKEGLVRVFLEGKWFKNTIIASGDITGFDPTIKTVEVKMPDGEMETRELRYLGSHMKASLHSGIKSDLSSLKASKDRGRKVGALKFCTKVDSIDLKEYGRTYRINREKNLVKVQNLGWLKVSGLDNIPVDVEFANAKLVHKPNGYYIHVTTYRNADTVPEREYVPGTVVGIDMGLKNQITTSDGARINLYVEETDRLKRLQRKLSRQEKGSNNYKKTRNLIAREYQKMDNKKNDYAYKVVCDLSKYEHVFFQDENLSAWKKRDGYVRGGKKIQKGILGRVKALLKTKEWATMLPKNIPTTVTCICGARNVHQLDERIYFCSACGYSEDRDVHGGRNMVIFGFADKRFSLPLEQRDVKPVESVIPGLHFHYLRVEEFTSDSLRALNSAPKQEAHPPSANE